MAYAGSTQLSSLANPPRQIIQGLGGYQASTGLSTNPGNVSGQGGGLWFYSSTNLTTDITGANFFSDGFYIGMKPGDVVFGVQFTSAGSSVTTFQGAITGVSTAGASLSTGSLITSTFN